MVGSLGTGEGERMKAPRLRGIVAATVLPMTVRLSESETAGYVRDWSVVPMTPAKHIAYAVQWFALGLAVTAEATPHHVSLTDETLTHYSAIYKVNPPLRTQEDVDALVQGLNEGVIDIVATDHAPHPAEAKDCEWAVAAFGMLGLETALSVVVKTMVDPGRLTWADLADRMAVVRSYRHGIGSHASAAEHVAAGGNPPGREARSPEPPRGE